MRECAGEEVAHELDHLLAVPHAGRLVPIVENDVGVRMRARRFLDHHPADLRERDSLALQHRAGHPVCGGLRRWLHATSLGSGRSRGAPESDRTPFGVDERREDAGRSLAVSEETAPQGC